MFDMTRRQVKLIELMAENEAYMPAKYYADHLKVSERTIFNDLAKLKEVFQAVDIKMDKKPNQGIKMQGDHASIQRLIHQTEHKKEPGSYSSLERQLAIVRRLFIENQTVTYYSLSLELYSSTTSIIKDMNQIRTFMEDGLQLVSDVKGTRIQGTEMDIQKTMKRYAYFLIEQQMHHYNLSSYAESLEQLFTKEIIDRVYNTIDELVSVLDLNISEQYMKSFFISLLILSERSYRGCHLKTLPDVELEGTVLPNYPLAVQLLHSIAAPLGFEFTEIEQKYVSNQLFAHRIEAKLNNKYIENIFSKDMKQIIADVSKAINIDLTDDTKLYDALIYHMFPMIYRLKSDVILYNPLLDEIKNNYGVLFRILWYVLERFEKKFDVKLTDHDVAFITIHFRVAIERKEEMSKILIVCQTGLVTSELITNRIKKLLPSSNEIRLVAKPDLKDEDLSEVDFIISSVKLENMKKPIVYVTPLIRDEDLMRIYETYLKTSTTLRKKEEQRLDSEAIAGFLNSNYVFLHENVSSKEECLNKLIGVLEQDGIVKQDFRKSVYEREKLGNTMVQDWVAIPHSLSSMVNKSTVAMMTTEQPIKWSDDYCVSFIVLLAVAEKDIIHIRKFLDKLYDIIFTSKKLKGSNLIMSIAEAEELINLFQDKSINS